MLSTTFVRRAGRWEGAKERMKWTSSPWLLGYLLPAVGHGREYARNDVQHRIADATAGSLILSRFSVGTICIVWKYKPKSIVPRFLNHPSLAL